MDPEVKEGVDSWLEMVDDNQAVIDALKTRGCTTGEALLMIMFNQLCWAFNDAAAPDTDNDEPWKSDSHEW